MVLSALGIWCPFQPLFGQEPGEDAAADVAAVAAPADEASARPSEIEELFSNYLHFVRLGRFDVADEMFAQPLLARPELDPLTDEAAAELVMLTDRYENSIDILKLVLDNTAIGENGQKMLSLIREAQRRKRLAADRIKKNIDLLDGTPLERELALERLIDSGEYAVPWMLDVLANPAREGLHAFVRRALPKLGRGAVNPLVQALGVSDQGLRDLIARTLGEIGYPQALPYLKRRAEDPRANEAARASATRAIERIIVGDPRVKDRPAHALFNDLAESYYAEADALQPDPREERANVWYFSESDQMPRLRLERKDVPRAIYNVVMCMRCCKASLTIDPDQPATVALWLAANFQRESRLGLDVESAEAVDMAALDPTQPSDAPRSVYYARMAGPDACERVLRRAIRDRDRDVALGAIAGLSGTAGPAAMVGEGALEGTGLADALRFPDPMVRIRAALALGQAMPTATFRGADEVVPTLASALALSERSYYLLIEPDGAAREQMRNELERAGATVLAADRLDTALSMARKELTHVDGIFLASDMERPTVVEAIPALAEDERFALAPVVVFVKAGDTLLLDRIAELDPRIGRVPVVAGGEGEPIDPTLVDNLLDKRQATARRYGYRELTPELSAELSMEAVRALQQLLISDSGLFDVRPAEPALIDVLRVHPSEELRVAAAEALAMLDTPAAQQGLAATALGGDQTESLRIACFRAVAESARRSGHRLDGGMTDSLIDQAVAEPNLALRTAASRALGAMNLPGARAAQIIIGPDAQ